MVYSGAVFDYTLWGVTQSVEGGVTEEKEVTQDFELSVRSADAETARHDVKKESVAYDDEYGFSGSLTLQDITIGENLQADSTYMATAHYAGTVTRTEAGTVHYTLLYAPVSVPVVVAAAESGITPALLIMGICLRIALYRRAADYHPPAAQKDPPCGRTRKAHHCAESLCAVRGYCPWWQK